MNDDTARLTARLGRHRRRLAEYEPVGDVQRESAIEAITLAFLCRHSDPPFPPESLFADLLAAEAQAVRLLRGAGPRPWIRPGFDRLEVRADLLDADTLAEEVAARAAAARIEDLREESARLAEDAAWQGSDTKRQEHIT